jgi:hypothetical protein
VWISTLPGLWHVVAPPLLLQVRMLAAEASAAAVIAATTAPAANANAGAMIGFLMVIRASP